MPICKGGIGFALRMCAALALHTYVSRSTSATADNLYVIHDGGIWAERVVDLGPFAGQMASLLIRVQTNATMSGDLFVDDVSLQASVPFGPRRLDAIDATELQARGTVWPEP
jgi:hypothetical protein